jgi:SMODS-associating 2TM, beta-strand rich effector domain
VIEGHDYTIYSTGPSGRSRMYAFLGLITASLTPLAQHWAIVVAQRYWGDDLDLAKAALFFGGFTALFLYGVLLNFFTTYLWRMKLGLWMFWLIGLSAPPNLNGKYRGTLEFNSATDRETMLRTDFFMRITQTWEQISLTVQRQAEAGGVVLIHSDMASIRVGMMAGVNTLSFVYTFEESLPRREGVGSMVQQFCGAATFDFRRDGDAWHVTGHFFDDIGRSGQVNLKQTLADIESGAAAEVPSTASPSEQSQL